MPRKPRELLTVAPFVNPSGTVSYRVSGTLPSIGRVRENWPTLAEALARKADLLKGLPVSQPERPVLTRLPEHVLRQAEAAVADLPAGTTLTQAVRFFSDNFRALAPLRMLPPVGPNAEKETWAGELYCQWLITQRKTKEETAIAIRDDFIKAFARAAKIASTIEIAAAPAKAWIYETGKADRTHRDRYDRLGGFLGWAKKQGHVLRNVVLEDLDRPVVKNQPPPATLTFRQLHGLLVAAVTDPEGPDMLPFFACCGLSGLRPKEQPRTAWPDVLLDEEEPYLELNEAKGGRARRHVILCPALVRILRWCKAQGLALGFFSKRKFDRIRRAAGVYDLWEKDILRHTYSSWHYALHKDINVLTATMGNSEDVLFQHYIRPMAKAEAKLFPDLVLDFTLPPRASAVGIRIDALLKRPIDKVPAERLAYLRTWLAGEIARLDRKAAKLSPPLRLPVEQERDRLALKVDQVRERMLGG